MAARRGRDSRTKLIDGGYKEYLEAQMEALGHNYNPFNLLEGGGFENDDGFHQNLVDWSLPTIHD